MAGDSRGASGPQRPSREDGFRERQKVSGFDVRRVVSEANHRVLVWVLI